MKIRKTLCRICAATTVGLALSLIFSHAQEARFFRVAGPVSTTLTDIAPDGTVTWTNVPTNATFIVQTTTSLDVSNWLDWVQVPVSTAITVHRIFDPNPPAGMALIPAGAFTMGDTFDEGDSDERPAHIVSTSAFYMDRYEVTKVLWDEVFQWATDHGYHFDFSNSGQGKAVSHPIHSLTWYDALHWCNARSQKENLVPAYYTDADLTAVYKTVALVIYVNWSASGYRLPTEAEWEKAARGGKSGQRFPWGNTISHDQANYYSERPGNPPYYPYDVNPTQGYHPAFAMGENPYTSPVGYFAPNGYGLYDVAGNVWEWCWDWYLGNYYSSSPASDPRGPASGSVHVVRGGGWGYSANACRMAIRGNMGPTVRYYEVGFRCVRSAGQ